MATATERNITTRLPNNDVFQTSYGVGHHHRPGYYFPDSLYRSVLREPLPADLCKPDEVVNSDHFKTTTGEIHDPKYRCEPTKGAISFKKAPAHWNIHFLKDHKEKLLNPGFRRPLSPSNQKSETIDQFDNKPGLYEPERWKSMQPFNLDNHHTEGPSKQIIASTKNPRLAGRIMYPKDQEVLRNMDPYLTTNMKYHRVWDPKELKGYPKKNATTFWECEEYPKAWGHGSKQNLLPKSSVPREKPPMRDTMVFKSATSVRRIPPLSIAVPHTGEKSLYGDCFINPSDVKRREDTYCPVNTPFILPAPGQRTIFTAPLMYKTEYMSIGKREPTII